jgi:hypothetical protein
MFSADRKHLSPQGRARLAAELYQGLISGYARYRQGPGA